MNDDDDLKMVLVWVLPVVALAVGLVLAVGVSHSSRAKVKVELPVAIAVPAPVSDATTEANSASVVVENGVVKFYFASGQADLAEGAAMALSTAIEAAKAGKTLMLSGYHDATGNPEFNADLAKRRALAVRDALMAAGVTEAQIDLQKPQEMVGTGSAAEARRVEVTVQP